jgi:hypothetical protein
MCKPTKKIRIKFNEDVLEALRVKYGYTIDYIRKSIRGDRAGFVPDKLSKEYKTLKLADEKIKQDAKNELTKKANELIE